MHRGMPEALPKHPAAGKHVCLDALPDDLLLRVFSHAPETALFQLPLVCTKFAELLRSGGSTAWDRQITYTARISKLEAEQQLPSFVAWARSRRSSITNLSLSLRTVSPATAAISLLEGLRQLRLHLLVDKLSVQQALELLILAPQLQALTLSAEMYQSPVRVHASAIGRLSTLRTLIVTAALQYEPEDTAHKLVTGLTRLQQLEACVGAWTSFQPLACLTELRSLNLDGSQAVAAGQAELELGPCLRSLSCLTGLTLTEFSIISEEDLPRDCHLGLQWLSLGNIKMAALPPTSQLQSAAADGHNLLCQMPSLTALQLAGSDLHKLMPAVCHLTSLRLLELNSSLMRRPYEAPSGIASLPGAISNLTLLRELRIKQLSTLSLNADTLLQMSSLQVVAIHNCQTFGFVGRQVNFVQLTAARPLLQFDLRHSTFAKDFHARRVL